MELLRNWAMTMAAILVLSSMCEILLPEGNFQKYVRLTIGIVLVIALVAPLKGCMEHPPELKEIPIEAEEVRSFAEKKQNKDIIKLYRANLEQSMQTVLSSGVDCLVLKVVCTVDETEKHWGAIQKVTVTVDKKDTATTAQIHHLLNAQFGVKTEQCEIHLSKE